MEWRKCRGKRIPVVKVHCVVVVTMATLSQDKGGNSDATSNQHHHIVVYVNKATATTNTVFK